MSTKNPLLVLSAADVSAVLDMDTAIESQRVAFRELGLGRAQLPARLLLDGPDGSSSFCYAARVSEQTGAVCKFGSAAPANAALGLPTVSALVTCLDPRTGRPVAIMDGTTLTTIRTAAASAVAVEVLARSDSSVVAVLGAGVQAGAHVEALSRVLSVAEVRIWGRTPVHAEELARRCRDELDGVVTVAGDAESAVAGADVVVCCTTSPTPVVEPAWLGPGSTVISVGSFAADRSEVPVELLQAATAVVVDDVGTALEHAGPIVAAIREKALDATELVSLGQVVAGRARGRTGPGDLVFYNSVGIGVQDAAAAWSVIEAARAQGLGQSVSL